MSQLCSNTQLLIEAIKLHWRENSLLFFSAMPVSTNSALVLNTLSTIAVDVKVSKKQGIKY